METESETMEACILPRCHALVCNFMMLWLNKKKEKKKTKVQETMVDILKIQRVFVVCGLILPCFVTVHFFILS